LWIYDTRFAQPPELSLAPGATQLYAGSRALSRKHLPTFAFCGDHPLVDVSGPSSILGDGPSDAWKYCVALRNGECRPGSAAGQVFVNCPGRTSGTCSSLRVSAGEYAEDVCVMELRADAGATGAFQFGLERSYSRGELARRLTSGLARYRRTMSQTASNGKPTPAGEWALFATAFVDGFRGYHFGVKIPPFPPEDSVGRNTFSTVQVQTGSAPLGTQSVAAEFGYGPDLFCASRREVCIATRSGLDTSVPFYWGSETHAGQACASGCSIAIPALPGRVVYYRLVYRAADNSIVGRSQIQTVQAP
jgi:hypothetical protein